MIRKSWDNFACAASRLGLQVGFLGSVGDDENGRLLIEDFRRFGVAIDHLRVRSNTESNFTVILLDQTGERAIVWVPVYSDGIELDQAAVDYIAGAKVLYTMPWDLDLFQRLAKVAHEGNTLVAIDVEPTVVADTARLRVILSSTAIVFFNRPGLANVMHEGVSLPEAARQMLAHGPRLVVVTLGKDGCLVVSDDETVESLGFAVEVKDTTGAGDCFNAAFLTGYLRGWPLSTTATFANAAAALSVTAVGPRAGLPDLEAVWSFLKERGVSS